MADILQRSVRSFSWNAGAQAVAVGVGFARSVLLARMLSVETFGIYAGATTVIGLLAIPAGMGMLGGLVHRAPETEDEDRAAAVYQSMQTAIAVVWAVLITIGTLIFAGSDSKAALLVIAWSTALEMLAFPAAGVEQRRVVMQRIGKLLILQTLLVAVVVVGMAWYGWELWALLAGDVVAAVTYFAAHVLWKPYWKPRFDFDVKIARYYVRFGIPTMLSFLVEYALQRFDDLYVRYWLGVREMGLYARAYTFATYPRAILALPVAMVAGASFSELADNRLRISKAFFRTSALVIRSSFLIGGLLIVIAPEFVSLLLGAKWLPMVTILRLFAIFTLFDPLRDILSSVYVALGLPTRLLANRLIQLAVLLVGLWLLGERWGTEGVAVAVNLMLLTGLTLMFAAIKPYIDFSVIRLFGAPLIATVLGAAAVIFAAWMGWASDSTFWRMLLYGTLYVAVYSAILFAIERKELWDILQKTLVQLRMSKTPVAANPAIINEVFETPGDLDPPQ